MVKIVIAFLILGGLFGVWVYNTLKEDKLKEAREIAQKNLEEALEKESLLEIQKQTDQLEQKNNNTEQKLWQRTLNSLEVE